MTMIIDGSLGTTFPDSSLQPAAASPYVLKNKIINGDMVIDQRNNGASITPASATTTYTLDRWNFYPSQASKFTTQQNAGSVTPPAGFSNYLGVTSSSAYSLAAGDLFVLQQSIEGFNVADLAWGTANARTVTLSFWVRSSLTGTFAGVLQNSAQNRTYPFTYTISSANTWTQISITIAGDTTGTWLTTNGIGLRIVFSLGTGSTFSGTAGAWVGTGLFSVTGATSVVGTSGATWYITGVQLEQNTSATPFERRLYNQELANCQRYYINVGGDQIYQNLCVLQAFGSTGANGGAIPFPVKMRAAPTLSYSSLSHFYVQNSTGSGITPTVIEIGGNESSSMCGSIRTTVSSGLSAGNASAFFTGSTSARINFSAEL
jgi:hypothetical protein